MPSEHDREAVDEASSPSSAGQFVARLGGSGATNGCGRWIEAELLL